MRASPTDDNAAYDDSSPANETLIFDWILIFRGRCRRESHMTPDGAAPFVFSGIPLPTKLFCRFLIVPVQHLRQFPAFSGNVSVIFPVMRKPAVCTDLDPGLCKPEIPPAFISQGIKRAITEQTVEIVRISPCMAGKVFTLLMAEIGEGFALPGMTAH